MTKAFKREFVELNEIEKGVLTIATYNILYMKELGIMGTEITLLGGSKLAVFDNLEDIENKIMWGR